MIHFNYNYKTILKIAAIVVGCIPLLILLLWALIQTPLSKQMLANYISDNASKVLPYDIELTGLRGIIPFNIGASQIKVSDATGEIALIEELSIDPSLLPLLSGMITIEQIHSKSITLTQLPKTESKAPQDSTFQLPEITLPSQLPMFHVKQIAVDQISIATEVFGKQQMYSLQGHAQSNQDHTVQAVLELLSIINPEASLSIEASLVGEKPELALRVDWQDAGKLLPFPLPLDAQHVIAMQLDGNGPLIDWNGNLTLSSSQFGLLNTHMHLSYAKHATWQMSGNINPATDVLNATQTEIIGDDFDFEFQGQFAGSTIEVQTFRADLVDASATAKAQVDMETQEFYANLNITTTHLSKFQPLVNQPLAGAGSVLINASGTPDAPQAMATIQLRDFQYSDVSISAVSSSLNLTPGEQFKLTTETIPPIQFNSRSTLSTIVIQNPEPVTIKQLDLNTAITSLPYNQLQLDNLTVSLPEGSIRTQGVVAPLVPAATLTIESSLQNLTTFQSLIPFDGLGGVRLQGNVIADASRQIATSHLKGQITTTSAFDKSLSDLLGSNIDYELSASWNGDQVDLAQFNIISNSFNIESNGAYNLASQELQATWTAAIQNVSPLSNALNRPLSGSLTSLGSAQGTVNALQVTNKIESNNLSFNNVTFDHVALNATVEQLDNAFTGDLNLSVLRNQDEFAIDTAFQLAAADLRLSNLTINGPGITLQGNGTLNQESKLADFTLEGGTHDLSLLGNMLNEPLQGQFNINARLLPVLNTQSAVVSLDANQIETNFGTVEELRLNAHAKNLYNDIQGEIDSTIRALHLNEHSIETLNLYISGNQTQLAWSAQAVGTLRETFDLTTEGDVTLGTAQQINLNTLEGTFADLPITLQSPVRLTMEAGNYQLNPLQLMIGSSTLTASGYANRDNIDAGLNFNNFNLAMLSTFGFEQANGTINCTIDLSGALEAPIVDMVLTGSQLRYADPALQSIPEGNLQIETRYENQQLRTHVQVTNIVQDPIVAQTQLPMRFAIEPFQLEFIQDQPIAGDIQGTLNLAMVPILFYLEGQKLSGQLIADIQLGGTLAQPEPSGGLVIENATYDHMDVGIVLRKINVQVTVQDNNHFIIEKLSLTDGGSGTVTGQGTINMDEAQSIQLQLSFNNATLLRHDDMTATASGELSCVGNMDRLNVNGNLVTAPIEISIPQNLPDRVQEIEIVEIGQDTTADSGTHHEVETEIQETNIPFGEKVRLNISIRIPNRMFVRGRGMNSEWAGNLNVTGTLNRPAITGNINVVRGRMNFFNNPMDFQSGGISFNGSFPPAPYLNLVTETSKNNTTFQVLIEGAATSPNLNLSSDPSMPSDEILARLLFGRRLTDITPIQAIQLAQAANTLRGGGGAFDLMGKTRDALGVEQIELRMGEDTDMTDVRLGVGAYLTDKIYMDIEQGVGADSSRINVQVEILPGLSIKSNAGLDEKSGLGIYWKHDY